MNGPAQNQWKNQSLKSAETLENSGSQNFYIEFKFLKEYLTFYNRCGFHIE